jgi:hypothetical protein
METNNTYTVEELLQNTIQSELRFLNDYQETIALMKPEDQQKWADYKQAVLDIPFQSGFPDNVVWPLSPMHYTNTEFTVERI